MNRKAVITGVGCAALAPAAFIGLAGLTDYAGPKGWLGFAEIFGWIALCVVAARLISSSMINVTQHQLTSATTVIALVVGICAFTAGTIWLALDAPQDAKVAFTDSLQVIGNGTLLAGVLFVALAVWNQR